MDEIDKYFSSMSLAEATQVATVTRMRIPDFVKKSRAFVRLHEDCLQAPSPNQGAGREAQVATESYRCPSPNQGAGVEAR